MALTDADGQELELDEVMGLRIDQPPRPLRLSVPLRDPLNLWLHRGLDVIGAVPVPRGWSRQQLTNTQPVLCPELASLQRYTALPEGARRVAEDEHIAGSDYPLPGAMERRRSGWDTLGFGRMVSNFARWLAREVASDEPLMVMHPTQYAALAHGWEWTTGPTRQRW